jgi:hypothetical protein
LKTNVRAVLQEILEKFKTGDIPEAVALACFPAVDIPSSKWSFTNRLLMFLSGTNDARGFRQWKQVRRWVKKGARAIYILVPCFETEINEETGEEEQVLKYFRTCPVYRYEDTTGKPLENSQPELPELPLLERAKEWGLSVKTIPGNFPSKGYYLPERKEIGLATPEEKTFFHELAHASHERIKGKLKTGQDPFQEIVAELSAQALCKLVGKRLKDTTGNSYKYIESYAASVNLSPHIACLSVLSDTEKVLKLILYGTLYDVN